VILWRLVALIAICFATFIHMAVGWIDLFQANGEMVNDLKDLPGCRYVTYRWKPVLIRLSTVVFTHIANHAWGGIS
jgi:hypothetical protein